MLRLLIVALPLVVALPAAFDEQEVNALHFEEQSPLQFEVRSPPESRPHLPAATQDQHKPRRTLLSARTTPKRTHHNTRAGGTRAKARRSTPRSTSSPTSSSPGTSTHHPQVCLGPAGSHACSARSFRSALPLRARSRDRCACCRRARARAPPSAPAPDPTMCPPRGAPASTQRNLHSPSARASARRLACFADGLRVAHPVQAAAAESGRARRPLRPRSKLKIMLEAPALSARRGGAMLIPSARAHCHRAQRGRVLIAAPLPGCTPACAHPCM